MVIGLGQVAAQTDQKPGVSFETDIRPILESQCVRCHGPDEPEGDVRIDLPESAMEFIEPGDAKNSDLIELLVTDDEETMMPPPDEGGPLDESDIRLIMTWIDEGAHWPVGLVLQDPEKQAGAIQADSIGIQTDSENSTGDQSLTEQSNVVSGETADPTGGKKFNGAQLADQANGAQNPVGNAAMPRSTKLIRGIGKLHPAAVHMPLGLLMAAGLFALLSLRGSYVMSDCAYYCLWLGALTGVIACLTGWWFTLTEPPREYVSTFDDLLNQNHKVFWHRTSALLCTIFALVLALFAASARNRDPDDGVGWKLGLILLAVGMGFVGHQGGKLSWRPSHYDELYEALGEYIPGLFETKQNVRDQQDVAGDVADDPVMGATSEESKADE
jgi:uncharacterized membrane protein